MSDVITQTYYSINEEDFCYGCPEEAAEAVWNLGDYEVGDQFDIWEGEAVPFRAEDFIPDMADCMINSACDDMGEHADDWDFSPEESKSLQRAVKDAVSKWADQNNAHPTFYGIKNVKKITMEFINEEGDAKTLDDQTI